MIANNNNSNTPRSFPEACQGARQRIGLGRKPFQPSNLTRSLSSSSSTEFSRLAYKTEFIDDHHIVRRLYIVLTLTREYMGFSLTGGGTLHQGTFALSSSDLHHAPYPVTITEGFLCDNGDFYWIEDIKTKEQEKMANGEVALLSRKCLVQGNFYKDMSKPVQATRVSEGTLSTTTCYETSFASFQQVKLFSKIWNKKLKAKKPTSHRATEDVTVVVQVDKTNPTDSWGVAMTQASAGGPVIISKLRPGTPLGDVPHLELGMAVAFIQDQPIVTLHQAIELLRATTQSLKIVAIADPEKFYPLLMEEGGLTTISFHKNSADDRTGLIFATKPTPNQTSALFVERVREDSLASTAGAMAGMQVLSINQFNRLSTVEHVIQRIRNLTGPVALLVLSRPCAMDPYFQHKKSNLVGTSLAAAEIAFQVGSFFSFLG